MIIALVIIATILLFICMTAIKPANLRIVLSSLCAVVIVASMVLMVKNDREHFGMHRVSQTKNYSLVSTASSANTSMLLYKAIGTAGKEKTYLYKTTEQPKKIQHTDPDPGKSQVKVVQQNGTAAAKLKVVTTRWQYRNQTAKFWFGIAANDHKLIKRKYTFSVGNNWFVLSTSQAQALQKQLKQNQAKLQAAAKVYVASQVKAKLAASERQLLSQQTAKTAAAAYQQQALAQAVQQIKQQTK
jgi:hypothetical protein